MNRILQTNALAAVTAALSNKETCFLDRRGQILTMTGTGAFEKGTKQVHP